MYSQSLARSHNVTINCRDNHWWLTLQLCSYGFWAQIKGNILLNLWLETAIGSNISIFQNMPVLCIIDYTTLAILQLISNQTLWDAGRAVQIIFIPALHIEWCNAAALILASFDTEVSDVQTSWTVVTDKSLNVMLVRFDNASCSWSHAYIIESGVCCLSLLIVHEYTMVNLRSWQPGWAGWVSVMGRFVARFCALCCNKPHSHVATLQSVLTQKLPGILVQSAASARVRYMYSAKACSPCIRWRSAVEPVDSSKKGSKHQGCARHTPKDYACDSSSCKQTMLMHLPQAVCKNKHNAWVQHVQLDQHMHTSRV